MSINTNFPVRHIYERLQADSTKAQIARLHGAPQKIKKFFILALAKYIAMFLDLFDFNDYFAGLISWKLP